MWERDACCSCPYSIPIPEEAEEESLCQSEFEASYQVTSAVDYLPVDRSVNTSDSMSCMLTGRPLRVMRSCFSWSLVGHSGSVGSPSIEICKRRGQ